MKNKCEDSQIKVNKASIMYTVLQEIKLSPVYLFIALLIQFHPLITTGLAPITILVILNVRICKGIMLLHQRRTNRNAKEINMALRMVLLWWRSMIPLQILCTSLLLYPSSFTP